MGDPLLGDSMNWRRSPFLPSAALLLVGGGALVARHSAAATPPARDSFALTAEERVRQRDLQIAVWERGLANDPASAIALGQLAALHMQRGRESGDYSDYTAAESYARRSLGERSGRNGSSSVTLAASLLAQHRFTEARDAAARLVAQEPDVASYRALLAEVDLELGDYDAARAAFDSIPRAERLGLSIAPRVARYAELTGQTAAARRILTGARDRAEEEGGSMPAEQLGWFNLRLGDLELRAGRTSAARRAYERGLDAAPGDYRLLAAMARLSANDGDPDKAIDFGERAIVVQMDPATLGVVGEAYAARGDTAKAGEYFNAMEVAVAGQPGAYHRAWSLFLLDHGRRVDDVLAKAVEEIGTRHDVYGYDLLAWALHKAGRDGDARRMMDAALRPGTEDATLYFHAGMIARGAGDRAAARAFLRKALDLNAHFHPTQPAEARAALDSLGSGGGV